MTDSQSMPCPSMRYDTLGTVSANASQLRTAVNTAARTGPIHTRTSLEAAHAEEAAQRRQMAVLTVLCFLGWSLGLVAETLRLPLVVSLPLYLLAYGTGGFYNLRQALKELATGVIGVDLLMVLAATGAAAVNELPEGAFLLFLFSLSHTLEHYVLGRTRRAIAALLDLSPDEAVVRRDGHEVRLSVEELHPGDTLIVRPGERIAADGSLCKGHTSVDQSAMTGESIPVEKSVGDPVFAGTLNQEGAIEVEVTRLASESTLARIVQLVEEAQSERGQTQRFSQWFEARYTAFVLVGAGLTLAVPLLFLGESFQPAFYRTMTFLVVASPCAVVLSIPAVILAAIAGAARGGVLFKGGAHLEQIAELRAVAFDKTGTLTLGRPRLVELHAVADMVPEEVLRLAASAEALSEHPLAHAVVEAARERNLPWEPATEVEALVGRGVRAQVGTRSIWVGKASLFRDRPGPAPHALLDVGERLATEGKTVLYVGDAERLLGLLAVADTLREGTEQAVRELRELGVRHQMILTGDNATVARGIAERLGLEFAADLFPADKLRIVQELRAKHDVVAMVGDGMNDAPSLAAATLGISLAGTGTDVALETADVVLMADDLRQLSYAIRLARQANRVMRQNLVFAFAMMAFLLAATFFLALRLPFAVVGHEGSTALVVLNSLRLLVFPHPTWGGSKQRREAAVPTCLARCAP